MTVEPLAAGLVSSPDMEDEEGERAAGEAAEDGEAPSKAERATAKAKMPGKGSAE